MFKIKTRVSAISLVPLIGLIGFSGLSIAENWAKMNAAQQLRNDVAVALAVGEVNHQLQTERGLSAAFLASQYAKPDALQAQLGESDKAIAALTASLGDKAGHAADEDLAATLQAFGDDLGGLSKLREEVKARSGDPADLTARYTTVIATGIDVVGVVERDGVALDPDVGRALATYGALGRGKEQAGRERATGMSFLNVAAIPAAGLMRVSALAGAQDAEFAAVPRAILAQHRQAWDQFLVSPANQKFADLRKRLLGAVGAPAPFASKAWFDAASTRMDGVRELQNEVARDTDLMAGAVQDRARSALTFASLLASLAILGALIAAYFVGRSITKPLHVLTNDMNALAAGDKSVAVKAARRSDELGEMGRAVLVFRNAAVELERVEAEQARIEAEASAERQRNEEERAVRAASQQRVVDGLATGLKELSDGNLTARLDAAFAPEYEQLRSDFNAAIGKLQAAMQVVVGSAGGIHSGADEISRAADHHSRRSEEQAASLEETAAALDQITATVRKTAEGASQTNSVVSGARPGREQRRGRPRGSRGDGRNREVVEPDRADHRGDRGNSLPD